MPISRLAFTQRNRLYRMERFALNQTIHNYRIHKIRHIKRVIHRRRTAINLTLERYRVAEIYRPRTSRNLFVQLQMIMVHTTRLTVAHILVANTFLRHGNLAIRITPHIRSRTVKHSLLDILITRQ